MWNLKSRLSILKTRIETIGIRIDIAKDKISLGLKKSKQDLEYRLNVSDEQHISAVEGAETFSAEFLDYLKQVAPQGLKPLNLDTVQLNLFYFLFGEAEDQKLRHEQTSRLYNQKPSILLKYDAGIPADNQSCEDLATRLCLVLGKLPGESYVSLFTGWDVITNYPSGAYIMGNRGSKDGGRIRFVFTEGRVESAEELECRIKGYDPDISEISIYGNGDRVVIRSNAPHLRGTYERVDQFYYLGFFVSEQSGREYHVYGQNNKTQSSFTNVKRSEVRVPLARAVNS